MRRWIYRVSGIFSLILGALLVMNSVSSLTGIIIFSKVSIIPSSLLGLLFIGVGVVILIKTPDDNQAAK